MGPRPLHVLLLLLAACAAAKKDERPEVDRIRIEGNKALSDSDLKRKILTSESSFWPEWVPLLGEAHHFDPSAWAADLRRIERYYQTQGYYQAKVLDAEVEEVKPGHLALKLELEEGKPARLLEIDIQGLDALPPEHREAVVRGLPLHKLAIFREEDWAVAKAQLLRHLQEKGYAEATLEAEAQVDELLNIVRVRLEVTPRQRYRFGRVLVATGPDPRVPNKVVQEQVESVIHSGDWYDESLLTEAQARVFQLGVFAAVKVNRGAPEREKGVVPVVADVREAPFHTLRAGGGFGIDQLRDEVRATGEYTDRDFFGGLRRFTVKGKAGWAFLPNVVDVARSSPGAQNGPIFSVLGEFEQPRFLARSVSLQTSLELNSGLEPAYRFIGGTFKAGLPWRPTPRVTVFPSYNLDVYFLSAQVPLGGSGPETLFGCPNTCIVSYLEQTVEYDRRDDRLEPRSGTYLALSLQEGGGPLGGVFKYVRVMPEARGYVSFGLEKRFTLAARVKAGSLWSFNSGGESPIVARFFSGGNDMRGFSMRRLSPMLVVQQPGATVTPGQPIPSVAVPVGGKGLLEASLEARYNVWGDLVLALFGDTGAVTADTLGAVGGDKLWPYLYVAVGAGFRYRTPLGPIRVDLAFRLPVGTPQYTTSSVPNLAPAGSPFCFVGDANRSYAGSPEGACGFHLSIGEAF